MRRILTYIRYELKVFLGSYTNMFWMIAFPLLLMSIFIIFFADFRFHEVEIEKATVAYHEEAFLPLYFVEAPKELPNMATLDKTSIENSLFQGKAMTEEQALEALKNEKIDGYVDEELRLVISRNGISQMIMDEVLTTSKQIAKLNLPYTAYDFDRSYTESIDEEYSPIDVVFYALFAMISLYGAYLSGTIGNRLIVRGQSIALRNTTSPTSKAWQVMIGVAASFLWSLFLVALTVVYVEFVLKQHFFSPDVNNIPLIVSALVFGISWGLFLGTVIKKESLQTTALIGSLLIMAGISGMFSNDIRILLQRSFPSLIQFNPVSRISDELIKVNMLGNYSTLSSTVLLLAAYSGVLIVVSILCVRRKKA